MRSLSGRLGHYEAGQLLNPSATSQPVNGYTVDQLASSRLDAL